MPELGQRKSKISLENLVYQKVRKYSKNDVYMSKGHRGQCEGVPTAQIWDYINVKIMILEVLLLNEIRICEPI